jgi:hypothetical protein
MSPGHVGVFPVPRDALKIPIDLAKIKKIPTFCPDDKQDVTEIQKYLRHFGFMSLSDSTSPKSDDQETVAALSSFQQFFGLKADGIFGPKTRTAMTDSRCGFPDLLQSVDFNVAGPWKKKNLTYCFGKASSQLDANVAKNAIRRAMTTWVNAGVGLTFTEVNSNQSPDIFVEWRPATDPDHSMVGTVLAHADFPPGYSIIANGLPLPLHYDDTEHKWVDGAVDSSFDIETIGLHELGHILGLHHSTVEGSVMYPRVAANLLNRSLTEDDRNGIRNLYPVWRSLGGKYFGE